MIERYKNSEIEQIFSDKNKFDIWLSIEKRYCIELAELKGFTTGQIKEISSICIKPEEIYEIEYLTKHDLAAFVKVFSSKLQSQIANFVHFGLTSSDIVDTTQAIQVCSALNLLINKLDLLINVLYKLAVKYKHTVCAGRTHGIHAEIMTFGLRIVGWYSELLRCKNRLINSWEYIRYGKLSGALGIPDNPNLELRILTNFDLKPEVVATQIIPRDRYAELLHSLAMLGNWCERVSTELRTLQRTEIAEVSENFSKDQIGSSAMPHKKNPISSEKICGLSRILRSYVQAAYENTNLWDERDISHSSTERIIIPDSFHIIMHMVETLTNSLQTLKVYPEKMLDNINQNKGAIYSSWILNFVLKENKEMNRDEAYKLTKEIISDPQKIFAFQNKIGFQIGRRLQDIDLIYEKVFLNLKVK